MNLFLNRSPLIVSKVYYPISVHPSQMYNFSNKYDTFVFYVLVMSVSFSVLIHSLGDNDNEQCYGTLTQFCTSRENREVRILIVKLMKSNRFQLQSRFLDKTKSTKSSPTKR